MKCNIFVLKYILAVPRWCVHLWCSLTQFINYNATDMVLCELFQYVKLFW